MEGGTSASGDINFNPNEFNEATCPICMDHPHNAVLLICSSHEKGCRSFICDSSSRHSNCLERFKSLSEANPSESGSSVEGVFRSPNEENNSLISVGEEPDRNFEAQVEERVNLEESSSQMNLKCPLCRGDVLGWMIVKEARDYLDLKLRSCALDSCSFSGNYEELRRHARREHPMTRPADVDPARQHAWCRLERQQERSDILSAIRSAVPEAVVLGDYVLDPGHQEPGDILSAIRSAATTPGAVVLGDYVLDIEHGPTDDENGHLWSTFFLFHVIRRPSGSLDERTSSRIWSRRIRSSSRHRNLWGENLLGLQDEEDEEEEDEEVEEGTGFVLDSRSVRRHRRIASSRTLVGDGDGLNEDYDVSLPRRRRRRLNEDDDLSLPDDEQT